MLSENLVIDMYRLSPSKFTLIFSELPFKPANTIRVTLDAQIPGWNAPQRNEQGQLTRSSSRPQSRISSPRGSVTSVNFTMPASGLPVPVHSTPHVSRELPPNPALATPFITPSVSITPPVANTEHVTTPATVHQAVRAPVTQPQYAAASMPHGKSAAGPALEYNPSLYNDAEVCALINWLLFTY